MRIINLIPGELLIELEEITKKQKVPIEAYYLCYEAISFLNHATNRTSSVVKWMSTRDSSLVSAEIYPLVTIEPLLLLDLVWMIPNAAKSKNVLSII